MLDKLVKGATNIFNQGTEIFGGVPKGLTKTSSTSNQGDPYRHNIAKGYQGLLDRGFQEYTGANPYGTAATQGQQQQQNLLGGLQNYFSGPNMQAIRQAQQNAAQYNPNAVTSNTLQQGIDKFMNPMQKQMFEGIDADKQAAIQMAYNTEGDMAQQLGAAGPGSTRSRDQRLQAMMDAALPYDRMKQNVRSQTWDRAADLAGVDIGLQRALQNQNIQNQMAAKNLNLAGASQARNINPELGLAGAFGNVGLNQQQQRDRANMFDYDQFLRKQNWEPQMLGQFGNFVNQGQWGGSQTAKGQGKSDLMNLAGMGVGLLGAGLSGGLKFGMG
ncbi:MAG: hypothetical protein Unbinned2902contig1001_41 [Prokaryotic dsDNA virus sp.]|nr:MAG: hypothetical protein Unbinned2902contig1001_41 [Prokaryotic dsDNA virus sp.]|tara:strand:- start:30269 stop:31255 length:987 start_codon:yes stop_codon:yes gene_type:complete